MKVAFVASHPPLPLDNGGRLRTFHLLDELSQRGRVALVCLDREPGSGVDPCPAEAIRLALPALESVDVVPAPPARKRARQLASLAGRGSYTVAMHHTPALTAAARAVAQGFEPELVHCDSLFCAYVHPDTPASDAVWVLSMHNCESLLKERLADTADEWLRRVLYRREARALAEVERRHMARFDHVVAVSEAERQRFAAHAGSTLVAPNGVEPRPEPGPPSAPEPGEPLRLLFVGSLNYEPNAQGVEWFACEVAPRVRERVGAIEVRVAGPGRRGPDLPGVDYVGRVDDLAAEYAAAHAAVVPLRVGAGTRLKVVEALAHGVPLVSTPVGVEGYEIEDGVHALVADEPVALAERIALLDASLRGDGRLAASLVDAGFGLARDYFWPRIGERLARAYEEWAASSSTAVHSP